MKLIYKNNYKCKRPKDQTVLKRLCTIPTILKMVNQKQKRNYFNWQRKGKEQTLVSLYLKHFLGVQKSIKRIKYEFYILPSQAHSKTNQVQLGHTNTSAINPTYSSSNFPYFTPPPPPKKVIKIKTKSILFHFPTFTLSKIL